MHFAGIIGTKSIHLIGSEFMFKDNFDHFYKDRMYRDDQTNVKSKTNRHIIIDVERKGKIYKTTQYFAESAKYLDTAIDSEFKPNGISVSDFSDGMVGSADAVSIIDFLK